MTIRLSLSPDGKLLAFHDDEAIYTVSVDGARAKRLVEGSPRENAGSPAFSPDGKSLAYKRRSFAEDGAFHGDIWVTPIHGGAPRRIVSNADRGQGPVMGPVWSPDGKEIAYACNGQMWRVPIQGGQPVEVKTGLDAKASHLSWSPDGNSIAFTASKESTELYLIEDFLPLVKR